MIVTLNSLINVKCHLLITDKFISAITTHIQQNDNTIIQFVNISYINKINLIQV